MRSRALLILSAVGLVLAACTREEIDPEAPTPTEVRLHSITVSQRSLVLPAGGRAELAFTVKDPAYVITSLTLQDGIGEAPAAFSLERFHRTGREGEYVAVLKDMGVEEVYDTQVCLVVPLSNAETGQTSYVTSLFFTVRSEQQTVRVQVNTGLPVVYLDTEGGKGVHSKTEEVPASLYIKGAGAYESLQPVSCRVRGRGNSTWSWPKKPYLIKLDEKASIFGLPKHKRWVLLANFCDRTLMRNLVSMKVSSMTSLAWTPGCVPVELVLDGKHLGNYLLIEQVRVDGHRVNVGDDGYLLECDWHYDNQVQWLDPHGYYYGMNGKVNGIPFGVKNPDPDEITSEQLSLIKSYISLTANAIYGADFAHPETGYAHYIDVDSFVDYWLVFEIMCNHELGNPGSVFMNKTRDGKLMAGPCWDFDWGILSFYTSAGETRLVNGKAIWYERLFQDPAFAAKVKTRFSELLPQLETIPAYMDEWEALLTESAKLNFKLWNPADDRSLNGGQIINGDENLSFHEAVQRLKHNYRKHLQVMQAQL